MLSIVSFTERGKLLARKISEEGNAEWKIEIIDGRKDSGDFDDKTPDIHSFVKKQFEEHIPLLFIGATGIAVRLIAPYIEDKLSDIPVLVMDDEGRYVIPVLSGHVGGANALAVKLADRVGAIPVITTATDIHSVFAIDFFAVENKLQIINKEGIAKVSSKALDGERIKIFVDVDGELGEEISRRLGEYKEVDIIFNQDAADVIISDMHMNYLSKEELKEESRAGCYSWDKCTGEILYISSRRYVVGIGCKEGKSVDDIENFLCSQLKEENIDIKEIRAICSIDKKADEQGLIRLAGSNNIDFVTYSPGELADVDGNFNDSDFVKNTVGVGNVCERSVVCYLKKYGFSDSIMIKEKVAYDGMTCAIGRL